MVRDVRAARLAKPGKGAPADGPGKPAAVAPEPAIANQASIVAVLGSTGSGKSTFIKQGLKAKKPARLIIWDPMSEYGDFGQVTSSAAELVKLAGAKRFAIVFRPGLDTKRLAPKFDLVCKAAYAAGETTLIVEELKLVTTPSYAPMPWVQCSIQGRHVGMRIIGTSQCPAHIDKDFLGNATLIRCGMLGYPEDIRAVAAAMRLKPADLEPLKPLEFVEVNRGTWERRKGLLQFRRQPVGV